MSQLFSSKSLWQFFSYFGVGGVSALVEWTVFSALEYLLDLPYLLATVIAFLISTTTNWFLGRKYTFKNSGYNGRKITEIVLVFTVSAIGLAFNLTLMYLFVSVLKMDTNLLKSAAKILSTGIVFIWNFLSRKLWIYRESASEE